MCSPNKRQWLIAIVCNPDKLNCDHSSCVLSMTILCLVCSYTTRTRHSKLYASNFICTSDKRTRTKITSICFARSTDALPSRTIPDSSNRYPRVTTWRPPAPNWRTTRRWQNLDTACTDGTLWEAGKPGIRKQQAYRSCQPLKSVGRIERRWRRWVIGRRCNYRWATGRSASLRGRPARDDGV